MSANGCLVFAAFFAVTAFVCRIVGSDFGWAAAIVISQVWFAVAQVIRRLP